MSIQVKTIDVNKAQTELKKCPKIVQNYVKSLENVYEISQQTNKAAIEKIKELDGRFNTKCTQLKTAMTNLFSLEKDYNELVGWLRDMHESGYELYPEVFDIIYEE